MCVCVCEPRVCQKSCELCEPGSTLGWVWVLQELVHVCPGYFGGALQCVRVGKLTLFFIQILLSSDGSQWFCAAGNLS